jgi:DNA-binding CsgD family transcriptional regulator
MAEADGTLALWAQATASGAAIPLGAFAGLIPEDVSSGDPLELVRRTSQALRQRAGERPVVLAVDDAQLLDEASAGLVLHLATAEEVFVLVTVREGPPAPDAIDALWKDVGAVRMELDRLSDEAIAELIEAGLGGPVEQATVRQLLDVSAGNPLYARELVLGAVDQGALTVDRGLWSLRGQRSVPSSLIAVVRRRIGSLTDAERDALELLALGEPLRLDEIVALASYEGLEAAEERGMVVVGAQDGHEVRLAHPLYGEVLAAELPVLRSRILRLRLAEAIQQRRPLTPDDALRASRWLLDAGEPVPAALLEDAAAAANLAGDAELGAQLAGLAIDAGAGLRATVLLARAYILRDRYEEAEAVLAAAEPQVRGDPAGTAYFLQRLDLLQWGLRRIPETRALLVRAEDWSEEPAWQRMLAASRIRIKTMVEGFVDCVEATAELLSDPALEPDRRRQMSATYALCLLSVGRAKEADELARRSRPDAPLRDSTDRYRLGSACCVGLDAGEDWPDLEAYAAELLRDGIRLGDHEAAGFAAFTLGSLEIHRGRYRDAERWLTETEAQFERHDVFDVICWVHALRVEIAYFSGDPARVQTALDGVRARVSKRPPGYVQRSYIAHAEGWAACALNGSAGSERFIEEAERAADANLRSHLLYQAMRAGARPATVAPLLVELASRSDSRLIDARAAHAASRAAGDGQGILAAGDQLAALGAQVAAMDAAVDAARQFIAEGRVDSARRAAWVARERHAADQGAEFPLIDGLEGVAVELSRREAQIAALAGRGLSNQEIADQLVLSVRTVETYVYRAMQKRGVSNRREL